MLVVTAHPDDVDFGFAGTVARLTDAGIEVTYCIVTDGDAGGAETGLPREEMAGRGATSRRRPPQWSACTICASSAIPTGGSSRRSICGATSRA